MALFTLIRQEMPFIYPDINPFNRFIKRSPWQKSLNGLYCHINLEGVPIYSQEFVQLDNFYNRIAWAETTDHQFVQIKETGEIEIVSELYSEFVMTIRRVKEHNKWGEESVMKNARGP